MSALPFLLGAAFLAGLVLGTWLEHRSGRRIAGAATRGLRTYDDALAAALERQAKLVEALRTVLRLVYQSRVWALHPSVLDAHATLANTVGTFDLDDGEDDKHAVEIVSTDGLTAIPIPTPRKGGLS